MMSADFCSTVEALAGGKPVASSVLASLTAEELVQMPLECLKGTSMAATITVMEMFRQAQVINGRVYESLGLYSEVALIYLAFCSLLTLVQRWGEKKLSSYGGVR